MDKLKFILLFVSVQSAFYGCKTPNDSNDRQESILNQVYPNGSITNIKILSNGVIMALSESGVLRSSNKGKSWQYVITEYTNGTIADTKEGDVYLSAGDRVYSSTDFGYFWTFTDSVSTYIYDSSPYTEIFRGMVVTSNNYVFAVSASNIFCSTNHGKNWFKPDTSFHSYDVEGIIQINDTLYINGIFGVLRSADYGVHWDSIDRVDAWGARMYTDSLHNIFVSNFDGSTYRSSNRGSSWQKIYNDYLNAITVGRNNTLFATDIDLLKSTDNGLTWNIAATINELGVGMNAIAIDEEGFLYVGASVTGIYKSKQSFY